MPASDYSGLYQSAGQQYGIDPALIQSVLTTESGGDTKAVSSAGASGPMQLMPATAKALGVTDPTDPEQAIPAAAKLLAENGKRYGGPEGAILAYHGGTDQKNWGPKTHAYLAKVSTTYQQLKNGSSMTSDQPSDDAFSAAFSSAPGKAAPPAAAAGPDAFSAAFGAPANSNAKPESASPQTAAQQPGAYQSFGAGLVRGFKDVRDTFDPANAWVLKKLGATAPNGLMGGIAPVEQATANHLADRQQFDQQADGNIPAQVGRVGGQIAATLPAMAAGGEVLGPVAAGIRAAVPAAGPILDFAAGGTSGGNKLFQLASKGVAGAGQGAAAAALTSGGSDQSIGQQVQQGAEFGGVLGAGAPALHDAGAAAYNRLTGGGIQPARAALADQAVNKFGISLRGSQISQSPFVRYLDSAVSKVPFSGMEGQNEAQRTAFTRAVAGTMGANADNLTPQVMSGIRSNLGNNYNQVAARTNIPIAGTAGDPLRTSFGNIIGEASRVLNDSDIKPLQNQVSHILGSADPASGSITGDVYKALTADGGSLDRLTQSKDPNVRFYASKIEQSLNNALTANANPQDVALLKQTNRQWKNMRTVQDLAAKAGIEGEISPPALLGAVKKSYKDMAFSGAGDIGNLAHIGQQFLKEPPSSGTGERMALYSMLGLGGDATAQLLHDPNALLHTGAGLAGITGTSRVIGSVLKSRLYRDALLNSAARSHSATNSLFGVSSGVQSAIGSGLSRYALPSTVIGGNQLMLNRTPVSGAP